MFFYTTLCQHYVHYALFFATVLECCVLLAQKHALFYATYVQKLFL